MKAEIVREEMNRCGRAGIPFLFGVDFEGIHGFFVEKPLSDPSVYFTIGTIGHYKTPLSPIPEPRIKILHSSFETYQEKFRIVHQGLSRGIVFAQPDRKNPHRNQSHFRTNLLSQSGPAINFYFLTDWFAFLPKASSGSKIMRSYLTR